MASGRSSASQTGRNEAFLIDTPMRRPARRGRALPADFIKKYLRGQDMGRCLRSDGLWIILLKSSVDHDRRGRRWRSLMPRNVSRSLTRRSACAAQADGVRSCEPGPTRDASGGSCALVHIMQRLCGCEDHLPGDPVSSVLWPDGDGLFLNNKGFFLSCDASWILAVLNSPLMWWYTWRYLPHMKDEALSPYRREDGTASHRHARRRDPPGCRGICSSARRLCEAGPRGAAGCTRRAQDADERRVAPGQKLEAFENLSRDEFVAEVTKRRKAAGKLKPADLKYLREISPATSSGPSMFAVARRA